MKHGRFKRCEVCADAVCRCPDRVTGYVYFLQSEVGLIKIGYTDSLESRLKSLRTMNAASFVVLKTVLANRVLEKRVHEAFREERRHGEWFLPSVKLVEFIDSLVRGSVLYPSHIRKIKS